MVGVDIRGLALARNGAPGVRGDAGVGLRFGPKVAAAAIAVAGVLARGRIRPASTTLAAVFRSTRIPGHATR